MRAQRERRAHQLPHACACAQDCRRVAALLVAATGKRQATEGGGEFSVELVRYSQAGGGRVGRGGRGRPGAASARSDLASACARPLPTARASPCLPTLQTDTGIQRLVATALSILHSAFGKCQPPPTPALVTRRGGVARPRPLRPHAADAPTRPPAPLPR